LIGAGITALFARADVDPAQRERAAAIMGAVGEHVWVEDEALMDPVTAVSGSGPAYVFLLVEMLESAARAEGLDPPTARRLAVETVFGSARLARESGEDPAFLREQVTSRGGTTAAALEVLERSGIRDTFARAIHAATERSRHLAAEFRK
jgi:pyrroline-5-carboxylate reductase